jgi:ATP-dependent Clp protease ATP-binding subunit ClpX
LNPLDRGTLRRILVEPKNSIIKQYKKLFEIDGIELEFADEVLDYIVDKAVEFKLGARGLRSICETIMIDHMFHTPSKKSKKLHITLDFAMDKIERTHLGRLKAS